MRISDWSSDVCSSDLVGAGEVAARIAQFFVGEQVPAVGCRDAAVRVARGAAGAFPRQSGDMTQGRPAAAEQCSDQFRQGLVARRANDVVDIRSEEHTTELQSLRSNPYVVLCLKT